MVRFASVACELGSLSPESFTSGKLVIDPHPKKKSNYGQKILERDNTDSLFYLRNKAPLPPLPNLSVIFNERLLTSSLFPGHSLFVCGSSTRNSKGQRNAPLDRDRRIWVREWTSGKGRTDEGKINWEQDCFIVNLNAE